MPPPNPGCDGWSRRGLARARLGRDVLCQDIIVLTGQGDLQASWTLQWPATGTQGPASFDGMVDGGTGRFAAAHGTFHAATLPDGDMRIAAELNAGQQ